MASSRIPAPTELICAAARSSYAHALPVLEGLQQAGHQAYLVGGGVRDLLLHRQVSDWDVATSAPPEAVMALWPDAAPTGVRHGTVSVPSDGHWVEVTTYRADGPYSDGRHPDWVRFGVTLEDDLERRDFTVNAMALDSVNAILVDPHHGCRDLAAGVIRAVGEPERRFQEDGLRPLRGIRLAAALEFAVEADTLRAMGEAKANVAGVAPERIQAELIKLLSAVRPSLGLDMLRSTGLLDLVVPELMEGVGMDQNHHHAHDVYWHTLHTVDASPRRNMRVRLAALLHDIAKPRTRKAVEGKTTFYNHQEVGARLAGEILQRLRFSRDETEAVSHLVRQHMFHYTEDWSDAAVRRFVQRVGREHLPDLFALRRADNVGNGLRVENPEDLVALERRVREVVRRDTALTLDALEVDGADVMETLGLEPGPEVGRVLHGLLDRVVEDPALNERRHLLSLMREIATNA